MRAPNDEIELARKRIENVLRLVESCKSGTWAKKFWSGVLVQLQRRALRFTNQHERGKL
jgi:hypothetical protein|tara:strand:- start:1596 stop:1772 length:177 start_codon:yes stop_codon:yes gene_type:complete